MGAHPHTPNKTLLTPFLKQGGGRRGVGNPVCPPEGPRSGRRSLWANVGLSTPLSRWGRGAAPMDAKGVLSHNVARGCFMDGMTYLSVLLIGVTLGALALSAFGHWLGRESPQENPNRSEEGLG